MAGFTPNAATTAGYGQLPTQPVPVNTLDPSQIAQAEAAGYQQIGGMLVPPISGPASPAMSATQANAVPGSSASPTNTSGYGPMPGSGTLPNQPTPVSQLMPETIDQAVKQGYQVAGGMLLPPVAGPASTTPKLGTFDESNTSGQAPVNPGAGTIQGLLDNLGQAVQGGVNSLAGYAAGAAGSSNPSPSTSSPGSPTDTSPGRVNVNGVMMTPEEYSDYMGGSGSSAVNVTGASAPPGSPENLAFLAAREAEAEAARKNGGKPSPVVAPGSDADKAGAGPQSFNPSDPFGVNAPATPPDVPNGGPGSPGYNSAPRPEDDLAGWRDYDNNGIDDRKQNFVGSGVFNNPGAIMPGAAGTSPVGGWGNAVNTGLGGPVDFGGGGGGGGLSLGGYGDLGGYPGGGGAAGPASGGNFTAPGAGGGGFTAPPAPSFQFPDVSTIGGGATGATGGTGSGGFTLPEFQNPLTGGATGGGSSTTGGGSTGGTGVATTTGGGAGGSTPLVGQLAGSYQSAIDSANMANENRFATGLELLLKRAEQAGMATQGLTYEGMNDIGRMFGQQRDRSDQDLINRGLANTTVREGVMRGYATDEQAARNRYADDQTRKNIDENFRQQQGMVDWLGARNDVGPDVGQLANLASGVGAAGPAGTTPATTTPAATTPAAPAPLPGNTAATAPSPSAMRPTASTGGAFTKSSAPNPTINQPAASPQTTSLSGYGQSATASSPAAPSQPAPREDIFQRFASFNPAADSQASNSIQNALPAPSPQQVPTAQEMFGNLDQQWQGVVDSYVRNTRARQENKAQLAAQAPQEGFDIYGQRTTPRVDVQAQNRAASDAAMASQRASADAGMAKEQQRKQQWEQQAAAAGMQRYERIDATGKDVSFYADPSTVKRDKWALGGFRASGPEYMMGQDLPVMNQSPQAATPPSAPLVGAPPLTMPGASPQTGGGFPAGIDMAQFGGGGAQHINNRNPSQTGMPNPPPPSISGTINGQTFMSVGMAPATPSTRPLVGAPPLTMPGMGPQPTPAGPSLMGYPDASRMLMENQMQATQNQATASQQYQPAPYNFSAAMAAKTNPAVPASIPATPSTQQAPQPATQGAAPVSAMASGMPDLPASPQPYSPPPMPQGMGQVPTNQVYMGMNGVPVYTDPSGQRKPANYYPSLNQYGVMA